MRNRTESCESWATFEVKSLDESERIIEGIASTPGTDRQGDVVEPLGAEFSLPMPLLLEHDKSQPVGEVLSARPTAQGIPVRLQIARTSTPGIVKDRTDAAWESVKLKLIRGLSVRFIPLESKAIKTGLRFIRWNWVELSLVVIPANIQASITSIKSHDIVRRKPLRVVCYGKGISIPGLREAYKRDNAS